MYQIKVKDDSIKESITVICPSAISAKEWIYTQLLRAMREDTAMKVTLATMREIVNFYATQFARIDDFAVDATTDGLVEIYHGAIYFIRYIVDPLTIKVQ